MTSSKSSLATSFKTSCTFSVPSTNAGYANPKTDMDRPIVKDQPRNPVASETASTGDYKLNFAPQIRPVSSWIEDDTEEDNNRNGTPTKVTAWTPFTHTMPDYDSDVESVDLDDLPPSPPPLRYQNRPAPMVSQSSFDQQSQCSNLDQLSKMSQSDSFFVPSRSAPPTRLNARGLSVSLPALSIRRSHSILVSPAGSPITEEDDPIKINRAPMRPDLQIIILSFLLSPLIFGLVILARAFRGGLKVLIRAVSSLDKLVGKIKRHLKAFNTFVEKVTLAIENLNLAWQRYQQLQSKSVLQITNRA